MKKMNAAALLIISSLLLSTACMKTPEVDKDFGPEFTADELNGALTSAQNDATTTSVQNIKMGEYAYFEKTSQIETLLPVIIRQRANTVTGVAPDQQTNPTKIIYTITNQLVELDGATGNMKPATYTQSTACLEKVAGACEASAASVANVSIPNLMNPFLSLKSMAKDPPPYFGAFSGRFTDLSWKAIVKQASEPDPSGIHWTYHNLKKTNSTTLQPPLLANRADCGGRKNCYSPMSTIDITFDEVDWTTEQYPVKYSYHLVFSAESPYFANQLMSCGSTTIPFDKQRIAILQCETIKDFTVGHD